LDTGGHGKQPCAGVYLAVVTNGVIRVGDAVTVAP
jgi:MOSC domain-containing protein YiiM